MVTHPAPPSVSHRAELLRTERTPSSGSRIWTGCTRAGSSLIRSISASPSGRGFGGFEDHRDPARPARDDCVLRVHRRGAGVGAGPLDSAVRSGRRGGTASAASNARCSFIILWHAFNNVIASRLFANCYARAVNVVADLPSIARDLARSRRRASPGTPARWSRWSGFGGAEMLGGGSGSARRGMLRVRRWGCGAPVGRGRGRTRVRGRVLRFLAAVHGDGRSLDPDEAPPSWPGPEVARGWRGGVGALKQMLAGGDEPPRRRRPSAASGWSVPGRPFFSRAAPPSRCPPTARRSSPSPASW